ncbi:MAG: NAD(P)/FAD-dependent oxidoreductase [Candidatus Kapaibacteriales bacterium]
MQNQKKVYIIGAGVSGLIAAYELEKKGIKPTIIEQTKEVGGRVKTINHEGYALDLGFQVLLDAYPLAKKYLDYSELNLKKLQSGALIYANGKSHLIGDPLRDIKLLLPTILADIGSFRDKLRILKLNTLLKNKSITEIFDSPEKTTEQYLIDFGFSSKIIERFFRPFFAGIFLEPDLRTSSRMFEFVYKMFGQGYATIPKLGIGEISNQLKSKLKSTDFLFNTKVNRITHDGLTLDSGATLDHDGVIIACHAPNLIDNPNQKDTSWKSCKNLYFKVDITNIPEGTIALIADSGKLSNNLYAYKDNATNETILSVTSLKHQNHSNQEIINKVTEEVKEYTKANRVEFIHSFDIKYALPDIEKLKMTSETQSLKISENVYQAGDHLFNGSLNAAMESGRIAAQALIKNL